MPREYLDYIDRKIAEKKGIEKLENGQQYKSDTLEKYYTKGYLDGGKYDSELLLAKGMQLARDRYLSNISKVSANDVSKVKVDGGGSTATSETVTMAEDRYRKAIRALPHEFKDIVVDVCCEDIDILKQVKCKSERQATQQRQILMTLLRFGLARLVEHYGR